VLALASANFAEAERQARSALRTDPTHVPALRLLARVLALEGKEDEAMSVAAATAAAGKDNEFVPAETLIALDRTEEARDELERLRARGGAEQEVNRYLALLAYQSGEWDEAQRRFGLLARQEAMTEFAVLYLSEIAQRTGDPEAALAGYKHLLDSPLGFEAAKRAAVLLAGKQDRAGGFELLDAYAAKHPEQRLEALLAKVNILSGDGDAKSALRMLDDAEREYRANPMLNYERATVLERGGRTRESIRAFEKLLATRPQDPALKNALGYTLGDHSIDLPKAESLVRSALDVMPDSPAALDSLGWIRYRRGDPEDAARWLSRAYRLSKDGEIAAHWGEAVWATGREEDARRIWATALARDPDSAPLEAVIARHASGVAPPAP
jgi:Flp pilus assembly protein TadD